MRSGCTGRDRRRRSDARGSRKLQRYVAAAAAAGGVAGSVAEAAIVSQTGLSLSTPTSLALTSGTATVATFDFTKYTSGYSSYSSFKVFNTTSAPGGGIAPSWVQLGQSPGAAANAAGVMIDGNIQNAGGATQSGQLAWMVVAAGTSPSTVLNGVDYYGFYVGRFTDTSGYGANISGYIGIRFKNPLQGNAINYGWIAYTGSVDGSGLITGWGYDDSGAGIATGAVAVPEPSGLALLAAGTLAGTAAVTAKRWRRERTLPSAA